MIEKIIEKTISGKGDSDKHLLTLFSLCLTTNGKNFIELGVRNGDTTLPLLLASQKLGATLYSVDIKKSDFEPEKNLNSFWEFFEMDSVKFLEEWDVNKHIDLIYIDDWHSYDHVKKQLDILDKIVSPKTIILLHDLMYGNTCPFYHTDLTMKDGQWANGGPYRAVAELNPQFWEFSTIPYNNGLTILRKKYSSKYKNI
jgi:predicted O-methyltransferase YrrM